MNKQAVIGIILIIILFSIAVLYFKKTPVSIQSPSTNPTTTQPINNPTPSSTPSNQDLFPIVNNFYKSYQNCMQNPPPAAKGRVGNYCQEQNDYISLNFNKNLTAGGVAEAGANPITCTQSPPTSIQADKVLQSSDTKTQVAVTESFGGTLTTQLTVELIQENNSWKIDNIICPKP